MIITLKKLLKSLGFVKAKKSHLTLALVIGAIVGYLPGELVKFLSGLYPSLAPEGIEQLNQILALENTIVNTVLVVTIVFIMPILEELVFRGVLWAIFSKITKNIHILAFTTTIIFALLHMDLLHIVGVFPIGLTFAYFRGYSKSLYPPLIAHMINNGIAIGSAFI